MLDLDPMVPGLRFLVFAVSATLPPCAEATESFYKKLIRVAKECDLSSYEALSKRPGYAAAGNASTNSALNRNINSPGQSEVFRRTMGQVSRNYWATVSLEEKRERARKTAEARWKRHS